MNRVVAPAFYAQGNTKSPTFAGIAGLVINMIFALILIRPMSGGGIALALTLGSLANSILLFIFLKKNPFINVKSVLGQTVLYSLKMIIYSLIAAVPAWFVRQLMLPSFENRGRLAGSGAIVAVTAAVFALCGIMLLVITKDSVIVSIKKMIKR